MVELTELSRRGRAAYWVVAALAWAGVAATLIITAFDGYAAPTYVEEGLSRGSPTPGRARPAARGSGGALTPPAPSPRRERPGSTRGRPERTWCDRPHP